MEKVSFKAKFAGHCVEIVCLHKETKDFCRKYFTDENPDCWIKIDRQDILNEVSIDNAYWKLDNRQQNPSYREAYLEQLALYRKIATEFLNFDILLFHSSAIKVNGKAYIFTGKSGIGKSTHASLWRKYLGEKAIMINDDKPLVMINNELSYAYGTPWDGKHRLSENTFAPIAGISILEQSINNKIEEVKKIDVFSNIIQQIYIPKEKNSMAKILSLVDLLLKNTRIYKLQCNTNIEAAEIAFKKMSGN